MDIRDKNVGLLLAAKQGDMERVTYLLDAGADINYQQTDPLVTNTEDARLRHQDRHCMGYTALMYAVHIGSQEIAALLLQRGADPDLVTMWGIRALLLAVRNNNTSLVGRLLENPASVTLGAPLLHWAGFHRNIEMIALLLRAGADPNDVTRLITG